MPLKDEFVKTGKFLFRWRSYLPLTMILLVLPAMPYRDSLGQSGTPDAFWEIVCLLISLSGLVIRITAIGYAPNGTCGTNTRRQVADQLNTTGMYSMTRNPLYLGNFVIAFGISMFFRLWWFSLIVSLVFWLYYERIIFAEEEFLQKKFGASYLEWAEKTPAFIPNFKIWARPERTFSLRKALKNEYKTFFAIIVSFVVVEVIGDAFTMHQLMVDTMWQIILCFSSIFYITIRILKKKTRVLDADRR